MYRHIYNRGCDCSSFFIFFVLYFLVLPEAIAIKIIYLLYYNKPVTVEIQTCPRFNYFGL